MNSKFELLNEMVKCHKKILDILENDQRYRAENVMSPSEIVNIETKQEQVQESQTKEVTIKTEIQRDKFSFKLLYESLVLSWCLFFV